MFWLQISLPIFLILTGIALLQPGSGYYSNNYLKRTINYFMNSYLSIKQKIILSINRSEIIPDTSRIGERLRELGNTKELAYADFRFQQLSLSLALGLAPFLALYLIQINLLQAIGLSCFLGFGTYLMFDRHLDELVRRREAQMESEFPALVEMLTLAIAAGDTPVSAFDRVTKRSESLLTSYFAESIKQVRMGQPFHISLDAMSRKLKSPTIRRFVDALVMAMVRGAPIVEVLHRHVAEARISQRNLIMDKAGKAETKMMIPIVFLILPISVLFALWPSINQLSLFAS